MRSLGNENDWSNNYGEVKDDTGTGLTIAMLYLNAHWPASLEFKSDGGVEIGIFSRNNSRKDIAIRWGSHETRELFLDFHTSATDNNLDVYRLEQPLVGRAPFQHYLDTKSLYGSDKLANGQEWDQFWTSNNGPIRYDHPVSVFDQLNTGVLAWRSFWYEGVVGFDAPLGGQLTFLKTGRGGKYMAALQKTMFNTNSAVERSDGFDYSLTPINAYYPYNVDNSGAYNFMNKFDTGHNHWVAMPLFYYMTGIEDIKDAVQDYAEDYIRRTTYWTPKWDDLRVSARTYRTLALAYEFTKDSRLLTNLEKLTNDLLDSRDNPPDCYPKGRNLERGYVQLESCGHYWIEPTMQSFMIAAIHPDDVSQGLRILKTYDKSYPRAEEVEEYLLGLAQFLYNEPFFVNLANNDFAYIYWYSFHHPNAWGASGESNAAAIGGNTMRKDDSSKVMLWAYEKTSDPKYLERGKKLLAYGGAYGSGTPYYPHELTYVSFHDLDSSWRYVNNVSSTNNGNGRYTLSWTVPQGATAYQIKYSNKPIVDWLGFNQATRQYQYDPSQYTAFFAANVIDNEPTPLSAGSTQTVTIDVSQTMSLYNSSRNLASGNNSYLTYNPNNTYYFSIKYLRVN